MTLLTGNKAVLADLLFELGAVKFGAFKLKLHETQPDAPLSPFYFELRTADHPKKPGPLTEEVMELIGEVMLEAIGDLQFDCFTGLPAAGEPFADQIETKTAGWNPQPVRIHLVKEEFDNDTRRINGIKPGAHREGDKVLVTDDLITQADTKLEGAKIIEHFGMEVALILVLIDRMQGGRQLLEDCGYNVCAIFSLEELLSHYLAVGLISQEKADEVRAYVKAVRV